MFPFFNSFDNKSILLNVNIYNPNATVVYDNTITVSHDGLLFIYVSANHLVPCTLYYNGEIIVNNYMGNTPTIIARQCKKNDTIRFYVLYGSYLLAACVFY